MLRDAVFYAGRGSSKSQKEDCDMYLVDKTEPLDSRRTVIWLDGEAAFALYNGEMRRFHIEEGAKLTEEVYETLMTEILPKRARERALYYLKSQARTEREVWSKLRQGMYPDSIIQETVLFLKRYHYIDDAEYARNYIETAGCRKSRREIEQRLRTKGIEREIIREIFAETAPPAEETLKRILKKRHYSADASEEETRKTIGYLMRRGFGYEEIRRAMVEMHNDA